MGQLIMNYSKSPKISAKRSYSNFKKWSTKDEDLAEEDSDDDFIEEEDSEVEDFRKLLRELREECQNLRTIMLQLITTKTTI